MKVGEDARAVRVRVKITGHASCEILQSSRSFHGSAGGVFDLQSDRTLRSLALQ